MSWPFFFLLCPHEKISAAAWAPDRDVCTHRALRLPSYINVNATGGEPGGRTKRVERRGETKREGIPRGEGKGGRSDRDPSWSLSWQGRGDVDKRGRAEKERNSSDRQERIPPLDRWNQSAFRLVKSIGRVLRDRSIDDVDSLAEGERPWRSVVVRVLASVNCISVLFREPLSEAIAVTTIPRQRGEREGERERLFLFRRYLSRFAWESFPSRGIEIAAHWPEGDLSLCESDVCTRIPYPRTCIIRAGVRTGWVAWREEEKDWEKDICTRVWAGTCKYRTPEFARRRSPRDRPINQAPLLARRSFAIAVGSEGTLSTILLTHDLSVPQVLNGFVASEYFFLSLVAPSSSTPVPFLPGDIAMNRATWKERTRLTREKRRIN